MRKMFLIVTWFYRVLRNLMGKAFKVFLRYYDIRHNDTRHYVTEHMDNQCYGTHRNRSQQNGDIHALGIMTLRIAILW